MTQPAQRFLVPVAEADGQVTTHDVPPTRNLERTHEPTRECWCQPTLTADTVTHNPALTR